MNDIAQNIPRIRTTLEERQVENQFTMIEIKGTIINQIVYVLVDLRASLSYISPQIVEMCNLKSKNFKNAWLVKLEMGTKRKVTS